MAESRKSPRRLTDPVELAYVLAAHGLHVAAGDAEAGERGHIAAGTRPRSRETAQFAAMLRRAPHTTPNVQAPTRAAPRPRAHRRVTSRGPPPEDDSEGDHSAVAARSGLSARTTRRCFGCGGEFSPRGSRVRFCASCFAVRKAGFSAGWLLARERQLDAEMLDAIALDDQRDVRRSI